MKMSLRIHLFPAVAVLAIFSLCLSCASTGPEVSRAEKRQIEEEFNVKFLEASGRCLERIYRIGYRLITSPVPGHVKEKPVFGFVGVGVAELEDYARKIYGIQKSVRGILVLGTYPGSRAQDLNLRAGDVIEKLDGKKTKSLGKYFKVIRSTKKDTLLASVRRKAEVLEREIPVEHVYYNAQFFLAPTPDVEANAAFSKVQVGIGAIRYCRNDDELAVIVGHELAHTTLKHSLKQIGAGTASTVAYGAVAGVVSYFTLPGVGGLITEPMKKATDAAVSRRYEREADYYGMQHAFHSGYNVRHGARVFSRLATDSPGYSLLAYTFSTHPLTSERFLRLEKIIEELEMRFPEKAKVKKAGDWEIAVPLEPGETLREALDRLIRSEKPLTQAAAA